MTFASLIYRALKACDGPDDLGQIISFYHNWKNFENIDIEDLEITERVKEETRNDGRINIVRTWGK